MAMILKRYLPTSTALLLLVGVTLGQGFTRTEVTGTHLNLNVIAQNDAQEVDFATADLDLDGDIDIVAGRKAPFTVNGPRANILLLNDGAGTFTDMTTSLTTWAQANHLNNTRDVDLVDINNDGWIDAIFFNSEDEPTEIYLNLGNDVSGDWQGFEANPSATIGGTAQSTFNICGAATFDFDMDGLLDMYRAEYRTSHEDDMLCQDPNNPLTFINQSGLLPLSFRQNEFGTTVQSRLTDGTMLDIDGNGTWDIYTVGSNVAKLLRTDGMGGVLSAQANLSQSATYFGAAADFDNDGDIDLFKGNDGTDFWNPTIGFNASGIIEGANQTLPNSSGFGANVQAYDFDQDGDIDLAMPSIDPDSPNCTNNPGFKIFRNTTVEGGAATTFVLESSNSDDVFDMGVADFDGDGVLDWILAECGPTPGWRLFVSDPNAVNMVFSQLYTPNGAVTEFKVRNIPHPSGGAVTLYNLFSAQQFNPVGSGPFAGVGLDCFVVLNAFPVPPSVVTIPNSQSEYVFNIPSGAIPGLDVVQSVSIAVDPFSPIIGLSEVREHDFTP